MALIAPPGNESRELQRVTMYWSRARFGSNAERVCGVTVAQAQTNSTRQISREVLESLNHDLHRMLQLYGGCTVNIEHHTYGFYARRWYARREDVLRHVGRPAPSANSGAVLLPAER